MLHKRAKKVRSFKFHLATNARSKHWYILIPATTATAIATATTHYGERSPCKHAALLPKIACASISFLVITALLCHKITCSAAGAPFPCKAKSCCVSR